MNTRLLPLSLLLICALPTLALADKAGAKNSGSDTPGNTGSSTEIIGSKEAPAVTNVVRWQDKVVAPAQKEVSTSILKEALQPLDQDVLQREIYFKQNLQ